MQVAANNVLAAVEDWTGDRPDSCPWRPFVGDEFVYRVQSMWRAWSKGQFAVAFPAPSFREMQGVMHFDLVLDRVEGKIAKEDAERRAAEAKRGRNAD